MIDKSIFLFKNLVCQSRNNHDCFADSFQVQRELTGEYICRLTLNARFFSVLFVFLPIVFYNNLFGIGSDYLRLLLPPPPLPLVMALFLIVVDCEMEGGGVGEKLFFSVLLLHEKCEEFKCPLNVTHFNSKQAFLVLVFCYLCL